MSRILIVEDEETIADLERDYLELSGFEVEVANDGETGLEKALTDQFDLVILDLMLPGVDGFEICREVRSQKNTPIIMVSAKKDDIDKIRGLGLGADDYMTKPFSMIVLGRRVRALLKRSKNNQTEKRNMIRLKNTVVDLDGYKIWVQGELCEATPKEIELIKYFSQHKGIVLSRQRIIDCIWGNDAEILDRTIDTYIKNIRRKFGIDCISTVKGIGYRMDEIEDDRN